MKESHKERKKSEINICLGYFWCMIENCPECKKPLHHGQHKFADGLFDVLYCKDCGFRKEVPEKINFR